MKRTTLLLAVTVITAVFTGCTDNGKEYKMDKEHNIYYKGGLDESNAKKLAEFLKENKYFQEGKEATVQISKSDKTKDTVILNFIVDKTMITPEMEGNFIIFGGMIAQNVFSGAPLNVKLSDKDFKEVKNLGFAKAVVDVPVKEDAPATENVPAPEQ